MSALLDRDLTLLNSVICHHGVKGQEWYKNKADRWQSHARYAMGKSGPGKEKKFDESAKEEKPVPVADVDWDTPYKWVSSRKKLADYDTKDILDKLARSKKDAYKFDDAFLTGSMMSKLGSVFEDVVANVHKYRERIRVAKTPIDEKTGFHLKTSNATPEEDAKKVNPGYHDRTVGTKNNCVLCSFAYEMRRRGYDVSALPAGSGADSRLQKLLFPRSKIEVLNLESMNPTVKYGDKFISTPASNEVRHKRVTTALAKQGDGARGIIQVSFCGGEAGHAMAYEVVNGKVNIIDSQSGELFSGGRTKSGDTVFGDTVFWGVTAVSYSRLDNLNFDLKMMKEVVR